ncbi:hypothetical protein ACFWRZ_24800 [Streptomyces rubiginosohelvolus]|uniref:hypothetical protein n=1 Tax=Streptomyces rubiginosohelvolus TaxID=67362 RepID=UPI003653284A
MAITKTQRLKRRDTDAPRKPPSAYIIFAVTTRPKLIENNPQLSVVETAKHLSAMWRSLAPADRAPYEEAAKQDQARYEKALEEYRHSR